MKLSQVKLPDTSISISRVDMNLRLKDCEMECLKNCSCTAYASADIRRGGSGCITWYGDLVDVRQFTDGGQDLYMRVDAYELGMFINNSLLHIFFQSGFLTSKKHAATILCQALIDMWQKKKKSKPPHLAFSVGIFSLFSLLVTQKMVKEGRCIPFRCRKSDLIFTITFYLAGRNKCSV